MLLLCFLGIPGGLDSPFPQGGIKIFKIGVFGGLTEVAVVRRFLVTFLLGLF